MEVHFTPELEAKLKDTAALQGRSADELVQEMIAQSFEADARFIESVRRGEVAWESGEYLTPEQTGRHPRRTVGP
jgi:predicted transcriptional regulator